MISKSKSGEMQMDAFHKGYDEGVKVERQRIIDDIEFLVLDTNDDEEFSKAVVKYFSQSE
jgi:hypothetical protein